MARLTVAVDDTNSRKIAIYLGLATHRSENECRLSLRESAGERYFRRAKGDNNKPHVANKIKSDVGLLPGKCDFAIAQGSLHSVNLARLKGVHFR